MEIIVILWQVNNRSFVTQELATKLRLVLEAFETALTSVRNPRSRYLLVMPDYLFWNGEREAYDGRAFEQYQQLAEAIGKRMPDNMLVVLGSMEWIDRIGEHVSSLIVGKGLLHRYDKRAPTEYNRGRGFVAGDQPCIFQWNGLQCGIEICQDHEKRALLGKGRVDVHILLSMGQCRRDHNLALNPAGGVFVQCELETPDHYAKKGDIPSSGVYTYATRHHPIGGLMPVLRPQRPCLVDDGFLTHVVELSNRGGRGGGRGRHSDRKTAPRPQSRRASTIAAPRPEPRPARLTAAPRPARVAPAPAWQPDQTAARCLGCRTGFGLFTRRHHCRGCGYIFCDDCTQGRKVLDNPAVRPGNAPETDAVRVCRRCA